MKTLLSLLVLLTIAVSCTKKYPALPMDNLTVIKDSAARSSTMAPLLVGFNNGIYELRAFEVTGQFRASWFKGYREMGYINCPFCATTNLVEVKQFWGCGIYCRGKVPKDSIGLYDPSHMIPCMTRFYQQPLFPPSKTMYARFGYPYNTTYYQ